MSFKYMVEKISDNHYVLPKTKDMKTDIHAFLSEKLYEISEEAMWNQAVEAASTEGVTGFYLQPDCHLGFGIPIGGVVVTDDVIIQAGSGFDISCFTADTKISLIDGREMSFSELVDQYGNGGFFYVYSITNDGMITAGKAHSPRKTKKHTDLVEIILDNDEKIRCTPDHKFMIRDGSYIEAKNLKAGVSLMPLYRTYEKGYCDIKHPKNNQIERMYKVSFREINGYVPEWPQIIHHDIFNDESPNQTKTNDDPRFLIEMNEKDHFILHSKKAKERIKKREIWGARSHQLYPDMYSKMASENMTRLHQDPEFRERLIKRSSKHMKESWAAGKFDESSKKAGKRGAQYLVEYNKSAEGKKQSSINGSKNKGKKRTPEQLKKQKEQNSIKKTCHICEKSFNGSAGLKHHIRRTHTETKPLECNICNKFFKDSCGLSVHVKRIHKSSPSKCPFCNKVAKDEIGLKNHINREHNNHKIKSVKYINEKEDVFCLTVEKYHNFALSAGVFVHNCGIAVIQVPLKPEDIAPIEKRRQLIDEIEKRVATGVGSNRPSLMPKFSSKQLQEMLRYGCKPLGVKEEFCERQYIPIKNDIDFDKIEKAINKGIPQLGSVGSGNHYIEVQADKDTGEVFIQVHCGSRGYGWQTANHFFFEGAELRGLPKNRRESSWLRIDEPLGKEYWEYHNSAANYAIANRHIIVKGINEALEEVFGVRGSLYYEISHNLVQEETLILPDGSTKKGFVHRKGATRAFPAGHPDLIGTKWEKTGHPVCVPGSMFDGAAILFPKDSQKSGYSVNHGSGRVKPRGQAKRELACLQQDINNEMRYVKRTFGGVEIEGILTNSRNVDLSECKHVYKELDDVLAVLEAEGIAKINKRLYPVANLKGMD